MGMLGGRTTCCSRLPFYGPLALGTSLSYFLVAGVKAAPQNQNNAVRASSPGLLAIPRVPTSPQLEDFLTMLPDERVRGRMVEVHDFTQRDPSDGAPATRRTDVYLAYDTASLYVVFVCFDSEPPQDPRSLNASRTIPA